MTVNSLAKNRLTGLSSGLDTDTIIQNLMQIQQLKVNRELRSQTTMQWKQSALNTIKSDITSFRNNFLSTQGISSMMKSSAYNSFKVSTSGANASAVTITGTASASARTLSIDRVEQLAKGATATSFGDDKTKGVSGGAGISTNSTLSGLADTLGIEFSGAEAAKYGSIDAEAYSAYEAALRSEVEAGGLTEEDFNTAIEEYKKNNFYVRTGEEGNYTYEKYDPNNESHKALDTSELYRKTAEAEPGKVSFSINDVEFTFTENDTLSSMMQKINSSSAGVTMSYSSISDKFTISSKATGTDARLDIKNISGNMFGVTGEDGYKKGALAIDESSDTNVYKGQNAIVHIDGYKIERSSNSFTLDGLNFTLNRTTEAGAEATTAVVSRDIDSTVEGIKKFVDSYNTLIGKLESLLKERKTSKEASYTPLTKDEKANMSEKQIEEWEAIAKKGILYGDDGIKNLVSSLRSAMYEGVAAAGISPAEIGFVTGSYFDGTGGQIKLDEDKLRAALEKDPEQVQNMFTNITDNKGTGWMYKIDSIMNKYLKGSQSDSLEQLEKSLRISTEKITKMENKMAIEMEKYYKQFAAMEEAMSQLNSQSGWISSLMGSG